MGLGRMGRLSPDPGRRKPGSERERRRIRDRRRSQREALVHAICRKPHRGLLRNPESERGKQPGRNLLESKVAIALRPLPGKKPTDEHEKAVGERVWASRFCNAKTLCLSRQSQSANQA